MDDITPLVSLSLCALLGLWLLNHRRIPGSLQAPLFTNDAKDFRSMLLDGYHNVSATNKGV